MISLASEVAKKNYLLDWLLLFHLFSVAGIMSLPILWLEFLFMLVNLCLTFCIIIEISFFKMFCYFFIYFYLNMQILTSLVSKWTHQLPTSFCFWKKGFIFCGILQDVFLLAILWFFGGVTGNVPFQTALLVSWEGEFSNYRICH